MKASEAWTRDLMVRLAYREVTFRLGWYARADTGAPLPAHGDLAASGSTLWRTRDLAAAAIARQPTPRKPRRQ